MKDTFKDTFAAHTLSPEHLQAIGCVVVEAAYLESLLESVIWHITKLPESSGKFFTDQLRLKARIELLSDIAKPKINKPSLRNKFADLISKLKKVSEKRNHIVHGIWMLPKSVDYQSPTLDMMATKRRLRSESVSFPAKEIMNTAHDISDLFLELASFSVVCFGLAAPKKSP